MNSIELCQCCGDIVLWSGTGHCNYCIEFMLEEMRKELNAKDI